MRKAYWTIVGAMTLLVAAACSDSIITPRPAKPTARAANVVPDPGVINQSNLTGVAECDATEWHWVINGLVDGSVAPDHITAYFVSGPVSVPFVKFVGGVAHYALKNDGSVVDANEALVAPYASAELPTGTFYLRFNLSHGPCDGTTTVQGSGIQTEVHDPNHNVVTTALLLGSTVHDKAIVTVDNAGTIPGGSTVTFYFWKNGTCDGNPTAHSDPISLTGTSVDDGLPEGPLGAGSYGYKAFFTSGDNTLVNDSEGECEPLSVNKGTLHISTKVHDASHNDVTNGSVALGSKLHDFAAVSGAVGGLDPANSVTFKSYTSTDCSTGEATVSSGGTETGGVKSAESAALTAGSYGYKAFLQGDDNYDVVDDTGCEPVTVNKGTLHISTKVHDASHNDVTNGSVALGSKLHDFASVTGAVSGIDPVNSVTFKSYTSKTCATGETSVSSGGTETGGVKSAESAALGAGDYGYKAFLAGDANYDVTDDTGCEPVTVNKGTLHITTQVHDAAHNNITNGTIVVGSVIHDFASVSGAVAGFAPQNSVTFTFYTNAGCTGSGSAIAAAGAEGSGVASVTRTPSAAGGYAFKASLAGDANYIVVDDTGCEPVTILPAGKTQGFWGNTNGYSAIIAAGGYAANAAAIGRGSNIDTQAEAQKVLPNTGNACGKGSPYIFVAGTATATKDCLVNNGINVGTLNTASSQTLALFYNIGITWKNFGGGGVSVSALGCGANLAAVGLASGSTVNDVKNAAVALINGSYLGSTTQTQLGNLNVLLNCINKEA